MEDQDLHIDGTFRLTIRRAPERDGAAQPTEEPIRVEGRAVGQGSSHPVSAVVKFGDPFLRSPFPPPRDEENASPPSSLVVPERTVIRPGGSVTFEVAPFQQVAIYEPGMELKDIRLEKETLKPASFGPFSISNFRVDDPHWRIQLSPPPNQQGYVWTTPAGTFDEPGHYLVISASVPFLSFARLHGWVEVG
ncbi:hypothetical protein ACFL3S_01895 [Gemmatimonadota bacterium]